MSLRRGRGGCPTSRAGEVSVPAGWPWPAVLAALAVTAGYAWVSYRVYQARRSRRFLTRRDREQLRFWQTAFLVATFALAAALVATALAAVLT